MSADRELIEQIRLNLAEAADPVRAEQQQRYMKSAMPYRGVSMPELRGLMRIRLKGYRPQSQAVWLATVRELWDDADFREERYAATAIARHRSAREWQDHTALQLYEHLIRTGAWWDHVDEIAAHLVGAVLAEDRAATTPLMRAWSHEEDLWMRRASVICQLRHRSETDTALLQHVIEANLADSSFWLRKAIGWALREHAKTDSAWVVDAVARWDQQLSPLSRREALKHLSDRLPS